MTARIGLIGARGHTGRELLRLIAGRDDMELAFASSREFAGRPVSEMAPEIATGLDFVAMAPDEIAASGADAVILALPCKSMQAALAASSQLDHGFRSHQKDSQLSNPFKQHNNRITVSRILRGTSDIRSRCTTWDRFCGSKTPKIIKDLGFGSVRGHLH